MFITRALCSEVLDFSSVDEVLKQRLLAVTNYTIGSRLWKKLLKPLPKCIDLRVVLSHLTNCLCIKRV